MITKDEWIKRFKDHMRPHINDAPTEEELELLLSEEAEWSYDNMVDSGFDPEMPPEDVAKEVLAAIAILS